MARVQSTFWAFGSPCISVFIVHRSTEILSHTFRELYLMPEATFFFSPSPTLDQLIITSELHRRITLIYYLQFRSSLLQFTYRIPVLRTFTTVSALLHRSPQLASFFQSQLYHHFVSFPVSRENRKKTHSMRLFPKLLKKQVRPTLLMSPYFSIIINRRQLF